VAVEGVGEEGAMKARVCVVRGLGAVVVDAQHLTQVSNEAPMSHQ